MSLVQRSVARKSFVCLGLLQYVVPLAGYVARMLYLEVRLIEKEYIVRCVIYCSNGIVGTEFV